MNTNHFQNECLTLSPHGFPGRTPHGLGLFAAVRRRLPLLGAVLSSALLMPCPSIASPFAYVPNEKSGTISIIDCASDSVVGHIQAGTKPRGLAVSHDGNTLYVSDQPANALLIVDLRKRAVVGTVPLGESPEGVGISPAGDWVVAASEITNSVSFISTATNKKVFSVKTAGKNPEHAEFSPDGNGCTSVQRRLTRSILSMSQNGSRSRR
ncbi:beta-propeller fold lactonase family protein [Undibacterium arcticum]|uniref:beta-propeller fold lactonase family protein n=1 Tax=Undibacterium arcticum TaxID=1762892 RepID=UPI00360E5823